MYFDTHAHLDDRWFDEDREAVIEAIRAANVSLVVNVGADMEGSYASVCLAEQYDFIYAAVGVHPHDVTTMTEGKIEKLRRLAAHEKVVAIGEIGLDYHGEDICKTTQKKWFLRQLELAKELEMPYIVHDRDAHGDTLDVIRDSGYFRGVFHCYSGSPEFVKILVELGLYISFAGPVTFKNGRKAKEAAKLVPLDRLLIETDSPYLSPEPFRGKRNDSSRVPLVAGTIAELRGIKEEELAAITQENGKRFFNI